MGDHRQHGTQATRSGGSRGRCGSSPLLGAERIAHAPGGTGRTAEPYPDGTPFSGGVIAAGPTGDFQLRTLAPAAKLGSGDTFIERVSDGSGEHELTGVLNYMFDTTPAAQSWSDSAGDAGTFSYPLPADAPGTRANPLPVKRDGEGKVR